MKKKKMKTQFFVIIFLGQAAKEKNEKICVRQIDAV